MLRIGSILKSERNKPTIRFNWINLKLSYRHAVRGTRKGQWEKRPAYPKASKVVGKTTSIPKASKAVGKNAQHTPRRARQWEKRPAYPRRARQWEKHPAYPRQARIDF